MNVKTVTFVKNLNEYMNIEVKPNFKTAGPVFGPKIKAYQEYLKNISDEDIVKLQNGEELVVSVDGNEYTINQDLIDIRISSKEGFNVGMENNNFIILNAELTHELILEGNAREIVSKVQQLRKNKDFDVADRIKLYYSSDDEIKETFETFGDYIKDETLSLELIEKDDLTEIFDINGHDVKFDVEKN